MSSVKIAGQRRATRTMLEMPIVVVPARIMKHGEQGDHVGAGLSEGGKFQSIAKHPRPMSRAMDALPLKPVLASAMRCSQRICTRPSANSRACCKRSATSHGP